MVAWGISYRVHKAETSSHVPLMPKKTTYPGLRHCFTLDSSILLIFGCPYLTGGLFSVYLQSSANTSSSLNFTSSHSTMMRRNLLLLSRWYIVQRQGMSTFLQNRSHSCIHLKKHLLIANHIKWSLWIQKRINSAFVFKAPTGQWMDKHMHWWVTQIYSHCVTECKELVTLHWDEWENLPGGFWESFTKKMTGSWLGKKGGRGKHSRETATSMATSGNGRQPTVVQLMMHIRGMAGSEANI